MTYDFLTKTSTIFLGNLMLLAAHGHQKPHQVLSRTVLRKFPRPHTVPSGSTRVSHLQLASRSRSSRPSSEAWLMVMTRAYCRYCMILRDASSMNSKCVCRKLWVYHGIPVYRPNGNFKRNNDDKAADFRGTFGYLHLLPCHIYDENLKKKI